MAVTATRLEGAIATAMATTAEVRTTATAMVGAMATHW